MDKSPKLNHDRHLSSDSESSTNISTCKESAQMSFLRLKSTSKVEEHNVKSSCPNVFATFRARVARFEEDRRADTIRYSTSGRCFARFSCPRTPTNPDDETHARARACSRYIGRDGRQDSRRRIGPGRRGIKSGPVLFDRCTASGMRVDQT